MKQTFVVIAILAIVAFIFFRPDFTGKNFDTKPYDAKIDSLQKGIDSLHQQNDSLETSIQLVEGLNTQLIGQSIGLKNTIKDLKSDNSHVDFVKAYTTTQVDSFFLIRYANQYKEYSIDTTHLPIPVAKATIVDILELDKTNKILFHTDSLVTVLDNIITNKDTVIALLRGKEDNYQSIIEKHVEQGHNYKIQISGLKADIKKNNWSIKKSKIANIILSGAVIGLIATHK
jgi:hypothetical protein